MANWRQLRLLLWKDYLMRKRKLVTLLGILWAIATMSSLYIVRTNVDNEDYPTCGFPARALPSAGVLPFLQSFVCGLDNVCSPLDQYDEIPTYENSTLTKLRHKLAPIMNETVLELAGTMPNAIKVLATLADVVDEPTFVHFTKNGLQVKELFTYPSRVKRAMSSRLRLDNYTSQSLMNAKINFQGFLKGSIRQCNINSIKGVLQMNDTVHLQIITEKLCTLSKEDIQKLLSEVIFEVNWSKYITMLGNMYQKLTGDHRLNTLGDLLTAVIRMMNLQHFLPPELVSIFQGEKVDFSYVQLNLVPKLIDQFEPIFGTTDSFQILKDISDTFVVGLQYLDKIFSSLKIDEDNNEMGKENGTLQTISNVLHNAVDIFQKSMDDKSVDTFNILSQITNFIYKLLPENMKHDVLFYSTLLAKLLEGAQRVVDINMHIEQLAYNVTLRNPNAVTIIKELPPSVIGKALEALSDPERIQVLSSKINTPGQMFCDIYKIQTFFVTSKEGAEFIKGQLCNDVWKSYIKDLIMSFGVADVKKNINEMASLMIQETLGKDTSSQLYTIDKDFTALKNFTQSLVRIQKEVTPEVKWNTLFNITEGSKLMDVVKARGHLGKQILIVIHGALAKEIVKQNSILDFKLSPYLNDITIIVSAINKQLSIIPTELTDNLKQLYPVIVKMLLKTALNEKKTYASLSTPGTDMMCNGIPTAGQYLDLSDDPTQDLMVETLCNTTRTIEEGMSATSPVSKAVRTIMNSSHPVMTLDWNKLINNIKDLYVKLEKDYTYLFKYTQYGMTEDMKREVDELYKEAKEYWFGVKNMERTLRLSVKLGLRFLDLLDYGLFDVTGDIWTKIKQTTATVAKPIIAFDQTLRVVAGLLTNSTYKYSGELTSLEALSNIVPATPQLLVDTVDIIVRDDTDVQEIVSIINSDTPWPCSDESLADILKLSNSSATAVRWVETLLCLENEVRQEWTLYLNNITTIDANYPHLFLTLSTIFDLIVDDIIITTKTLEFLAKDSTDGRIGFKEAFNYAMAALNTSDRDSILIKMFTKVDIILNSVTTAPHNGSVNSLWEGYLSCSSTASDCKTLARSTWKYFFEAASLILENVVGDMLTYLREINDPNSNLLQIFGFTKNTGLYVLYDKMPEFLGVLLNSYWDYGFMSQVRRASMSEFWDCEAVLYSLVPPPGSSIDSVVIDKVRQYVCPSLLHWLSIPVGDNVLLDVIAKPQYFFYTMSVQNLTSRYEKAYTKVIEFGDYITEVSKNNTILKEEDTKMNSLKAKLKISVDKVLSFKIDPNDPKYRLFNEINTKLFAANLYLTTIVAITNKLNEKIQDLNTNIVNTTDLDTFKVLYKRKPVDAILMHFDLITDIVLQDNENYSLVNALDTMCNDLKNEEMSKRILLNDDKVISQICSKDYQVVFSAVQDNIVEDTVQARASLMNLLKILQFEGNGTDVFEFLRSRKQLLSSLTSSIKHSYDLSIPIYLKYLHSNVQSYDVILSFLAGEDWWKELKELYNGPQATKFFGFMEHSFEIAEELLTNFDQIHLVRLLHDVDLNQTQSFCLPNVTISDYFPDSTGVLSELKKQACGVDKIELFRELPPLLFASQGYENALKLSKDVNYTSISNDINKTESRLHLIFNGPKEPLNPGFVTEEKVEKLRSVALKLASKESMTKASFAVLSNIVDATTLFLNNSQCTVCSHFTTWFKQLNLQLFKKQEYDNLLCQLDALTLDEVYSMLRNDFHWDMVIKELISTRNYTKYEMNRSINEFLGQVKVHLLEDMAANTTKLATCLLNGVERNPLGNVTLFVSVLSRIAKLFRAALPHLHEIDGIKDIPFLNQLSTQIAQNLVILRPLSQFLNDKSDIHHDLHHYVDRHDIVFYIQDARVDLKKILTNTTVDQYLHITQSNWSHICSQYDCKGIASIIDRNVNKTAIRNALPTLQKKEFWSFSFMSNIIEHIENFLSHSIRIFGVASKVDIAGVVEGRLEALVDTGLLFINDAVIDSVVKSVEGLVEELHPLLEETPLEHDLKALSSGLFVISQLKTYILEEFNLKMSVQQIFPDGDAVETGLSSLGINHTNFWSISAPRIRAGYLHLKPLLTSKQTDHISTYICDINAMSKVIEPGNLDVVTSEDVFVATTEQFCGLASATTKLMLPVLLDNFQFSVIMDKVANILLTKLYSASNITESEGATLLAQFGELAALLPLIQDNVGDVGNLFVDNPVFKSLGSFDSLGGLLASSDMMASVGQMVCGRPLSMDSSRFYKNIAALPDMASKADQAQLDVLPTEFCRSLYLDIISVEGGKIVWSFIKPLLMGRILYTPPTPAVTRIMEKANSTFSTMIKVTNLVHSFASSVPSISRLSSHREGVSVLQTLMTEPQFQVFREMILGERQVMSGLDVDGVFEDFGDMEGITQLLTKASQLLQCINLNRFQPVVNEDILTKKAAELSIVNEFTAGVVFLNADSKYDSLSNVEYKIRMDIDNAPSTTKLKDYLWIPGPQSSFIEDMRYFRGFVQIQDMVDTAIIQLSRPRVKREVPIMDDWAVYTQQTPYPCYRKDYYQTSLYDSQSLILAFFFSLLFTVASIVRSIVVDKETGNTMLMSVMGCDLRWHTLSWYMTSLLELTVTCICVTLLLHYGRVLPQSDVTLVFALLMVYSVSVLSYCYLFSKLFTSASLAAVCAAIIYLMTFMPYIIILSLEAVLYSSLKIFICLSMSSSLCYAFLYITRLEASGAGGTWGHLWTSSVEDQHMSIGVAAGIMLLDAVLYAVLGWLVDRYFGIKSLTSNITHCTTANEKAGVSIVNITKIYQEGSRRARLALDNVSMELQKGQITTLLGHNGAGKTTLINILMGMTRATRGHITVRSEHGLSLGVCPQRDVLFPYMSAREHVLLYARLKTSKLGEELEELVDRMLSVLSLGAYSSVPVSQLSGGTRRRVCVALAFVGQPHLVSLDEPTSGVDPAARRDIWSMIVKLKEDRTILLTTHHLDEAELLSDQIVIMHKGQIHTTGSPVEIKRSLGTGYRLTVTYPQAGDDPQGWGAADDPQDLLEVVRGSVPNARVVDVEGTQVEVELPFFNANGLHNDYLQLCSTLEASQSILGFKSYSMDCSSLEQVFHHICQHADNVNEYVAEEAPSKSVSTSSVRLDHSTQSLLPNEGPRTGSRGEQFRALMWVRWIHHVRNRWLLFILFGLPTMFVLMAMGFSMIRPPPDEEVALNLYDQLYANSTEFVVPYPSIYSQNLDPGLAERVLQYLMMDKHTRDYSGEDTLQCECTTTRQVCDIPSNITLPEMLLLPDVDTLNGWLVETQEVYIEKRYGGFSSSLKNNVTNLIAWYNNKGHHALPSFVNSLNSAILRTVSNVPTANITTYTHPLKISKEPLSKATVYQHMADAGIAILVLVGYTMVTGGSAIYLVATRNTHEKRLALLSGLTPLCYWNVALVWHIATIAINMCISVVLMLAFGFPVFVERNNLPAICLLILLYGFACGNLMHVLEKLFTDSSLANMMIFCGTSFVGLACIAIIFIFDIISQSDATDYARYVLHKIFILAPPFALADGMLEIAKNTIQAQVLIRFGMDTYKDPLNSSLVLYHCISMVVVGTALMLLNLAIEYDCFEIVLKRFRSTTIPLLPRDVCLSPDVLSEHKRVLLEREHAHVPLGVNTLGNINRGFIHTEGSKRSLQHCISPSYDVLQCVSLSRTYGTRVALRNLTLGVPPGQCTALLGENGAGKSTTFRMLTGELRPTAGHIYLNGEKVKSTQLCNGLISYCPQSDAIDPLLTVKETLQYYCTLRGIEDENEVIKRTIDMFDLNKYTDVQTYALSGGNKRKLCTAIAFMARTALVLLDEPTSGMDVVSRACVWRGVRAARAACRGVLLCTHALHDARHVAARVALLQAGSLVALAPLDECLTRFGGGFIVQCRSSRSPRGAWLQVRARAQHARLRVLHAHTLQFLVPTRAMVDDKEVNTKLSDIFLLMAELQGTCDIEDYTINQSSLEEMFLSFTDKADVEGDTVETLPMPELYTHEHDVVTAL